MSEFIIGLVIGALIILIMMYIQKVKEPTSPIPEPIPPRRSRQLSNPQLRELALKNQHPVLTLDDVEEVVQEAPRPSSRKRSSSKERTSSYPSSGTQKTHSTPIPPNDHQNLILTPIGNVDDDITIEALDLKTIPQNPLPTKKFPQRKKSLVLTKECLAAMARCKTIKMSEQINI